MLYTKSIQARSSKNDGIRICIMRRPPKDAAYHIWMPTLSPSTKLLANYHEKKIDWKEYEKRFNKQVLDRGSIYLELVKDLAKKHTVTILCWEETPVMCHRRLTAERIQKLDPSLKIIYK